MHVGLAGYDPTRIVRSMDLNGIEKSWLLTWEELNPPIPSLHQDLPPEPILEACLMHPGRFVPFYAPDPTTENLEKHFQRYIGLGIRGCAELKVSLKWEDSLMESYLTILQQHGLPLVFHMENPRMQYIQDKEGFHHWILERLMNDKFNGISRYYLTRFAESTGILYGKIKRNQIHFPGILFDFAALEKRVQEFPGINFVGHGPEFWNNIGSIQHPKFIHQKGSIKAFGIIDRMLEEYDNFYCDISGTSGFNAMNRDHQQTKVFLQKHALKILYGTDNTKFPLLNLLQSMKMGKEHMGSILYKNALKILE